MGLVNVKQLANECRKDGLKYKKVDRKISTVQSTTIFHNLSHTSSTFSCTNVQSIFLHSLAGIKQLYIYFFNELFCAHFWMGDT